MAEGSGTLPVATFIKHEHSSGGATQTFTAVNLGASTAPVDTIVHVLGVSPGQSAVGFDLTALTLTLGGGTPINATIDAESSDNGGCKVWAARFSVPAGTTGFNSAVVALTLPDNPYFDTHIFIWTAPAADLSSLTPVDVDWSSAASNATPATSNFASPATSEGGYMLCAAVSQADGSFSWTWTGDESLAERADYTNFYGFQASAADRNGTLADAANTATATCTGTGRTRVIAVSYR